jgi:O-antigen ligase
MDTVRDSITDIFIELLPFDNVGRNVMSLTNEEIYVKISNILEEVKDVHAKLQTIPAHNGTHHAMCQKIKNKPVEIKAIKLNLTERKAKIPPEVMEKINEIDSIISQIRKIEPSFDGPYLPEQKGRKKHIELPTVPINTLNPGASQTAFSTPQSSITAIKNLPVHESSWTLFMILGVILTVVITAIVNFGDTKLSVYLIGGILGIYMTVFIFLMPELGAYLLIITGISNLSDMFTESGLPSLNQPLVALILLCVITNQILRTGRVNFTIHLSRVEWSLGIFYSILITTVFVARDRSSAIDLINTFTRNLVILYCIITALNTPQKWKQGIWVAIITAAILSSMGVFQLITGNTGFTFWGFAKRSILGQYTDEGVLRYGGPIGESNIWAQTLLAVLFLAIYRIIDEKDLKLKYVAGIASLLIAGAIFYTYSRGAFVTAIVIFFFIAIERHVDFRKMLVAVGIGAIFLTFLPQNYISRLTTLVDIINPHNQYSVSSDESILGRATVIKVGLTMFAEHPFLGVGVGNYRDQYWDYAPKLGLEAGVLSTSTSTTTREPHNLYVELLAETGIFGIMFFGVFMYVLLKALSNTRALYWAPERYKDRSAWIASVIMVLMSYLVSGLFLHGAFYRYFWMFIALAMAAFKVFGDKKYITSILEESN